jgi:hypothetical protein
MHLVAGASTPRLALGLVTAAAVAGCAWLLLFHQPDDAGRRRTQAGGQPVGAQASTSRGVTARAEAASPAPGALARAVDAGAVGPGAATAFANDTGDSPGALAGAIGAEDAPWIAGMLAEVGAALDAGDLGKIAEAEARLGAWLNGSEERALALVALMRGDLGPDALALVAGALAADPAGAGSADVADALLALAADAGASVAQREHALGALAQSDAALPGVAERLAALARGADEHLARAALAALASRAGRSTALRDEAFGPLMAALVGHASPELRGALVAGLVLEDASAPQVGQVSQMLADDPDPGVRASAASALGGAAGPARADAVDALLGAFRTDAAVDTRRAVLLSLVRLLGGGARERIVALRDDAGAVRADIDDYLTILAEGETQAERIIRRKQELEVARGELPGGSHEHHD